MRKILLLLCMPMFAQADITPADIDELAAAEKDQVIEWRRWFHENPELSNREVKTAEYITSKLQDMGLEPKTGIAHNGIVAIIEGGLPGPLVALRTDMDGLPVTEETGLPFASKAKGEYNGQEVGVMHACGHDAHMSMLLGAASILNAKKAQLPGSVMLIFQPAEEGGAGAKAMIDDGILDRWPVKAAYGVHNRPGRS